MAFDQLAQALQQRFFAAVASRGAVKFTKQLEPVERQPHGFAIQQTGGGVKLPACQVEHATGVFWRQIVVRRAQHVFNGQQVVAKAGFGLAPGGADHVGQFFPKAEKSKAFHQLHQGRSLGLLGRGTLAHLFAGGHDAPGIGPAHAQKYRYAQTAHVHAARL